MRAMDMAYDFDLKWIYVSTVNCTLFAVDCTSGGVNKWDKVPAENWVVRVFAIKTFVITFTDPDNIHCWDAATGGSCWHHLHMPFMNIDIKTDSSADNFCVPTSETIESSGQKYNSIQSISVTDGQILWTVETDVAVSSMAAIVGGNQFAGLADGSVLIVDKDGRRVIDCSTGHDEDEEVNRIAIACSAGKCIVVTGSKTLVCCWSFSTTLVGESSPNLNVVWKRSFPSTSSGVNISCLNLWKDAVFVGVDRKLMSLDLSTGRLVYSMSEHTDTIVWVDVVEDKYLCTATSSSLKAHSLWYQTKMAVPVCSLDIERDMDTSDHFRFINVYYELLDFAIQATFLFVSTVQQFSFSYLHIEPPINYSYFQDISVRFQSFLTFSSSPGVGYVQELIVAFVICGFLLLLFLFHKPLQLKVFESPQSNVGFLWTAALYSVQIIVGPVMLPLLGLLVGVFNCARDEDGVLKLVEDESITCNTGGHLALLIPAAIFLAILIYISIRLNSVDNDLGATEIRWNNVFDHRGDLVYKVPRRHPLTVRNTFFNQVSLFASIVLTIAATFGGDIIAAVVNIAVAGILLGLTVVPYYWRSFDCQFFDEASNKVMFLSYTLLLFTYVQALVSLLLGSSSTVAYVLPWISLLLLFFGLFVIFASKTSEEETPDRVAQNTVTGKSKVQASCYNVTG